MHLAFSAVRTDRGTIQIRISFTTIKTMVFIGIISIVKAIRSYGSGLPSIKLDARDYRAEPLEVCVAQW